MAVAFQEIEKNTREACDLPEILTGSLFKDWRGRV
jgi:hypothetical protein